MTADGSAVLMTLAFEDVREMQLQWSVIEGGSVFVPWPRPLASEQPVKLHVIVAGAGTADVEATVDFNDVDSFGRSGMVLKLPPLSVDALRVVYEKSIMPPRPSAPVTTGAALPSEPPAGSTSWPASPLLPLASVARVEELELPTASPGDSAPELLDEEGTLALLELPAEPPPPAPPEPRLDLAPPAPALEPLNAAVEPAQALPAVDVAPPRPAVEPPKPSPPKPGDIFATTRLLKTGGPKATETAAMPASAAPKPPEERLEAGTLLDNRFQIESHIATGGMGDVYRAAHVFLKRPIALKLLKRSLAADPEMWTRFQREAELVSQLESQHIVRVFDFGRTSAGVPFLAMEFVQGVTLDVLVAKEGPMMPERAVELAVQVCEGLTEAHGLGIVHRDLKPSNIILGKRRDGTEHAKILDFGIARAADSQTKGSPLTQLGVVVGTPAYLAPEQAVADTLDARTDIYALGCVVFELLTGRPPFIADSIQRLMAMHVTDAPPSPSSLRADLAAYPALCEVVQKALSKDRALRHQNAIELAKALRESVKKQAIPGAFEDWPPADAPPAAGTTDAWPPPPPAHQPPPAVATHNLEWGPPPSAALKAAAAPAPAAASWPPPEPAASPVPEAKEVNSFFAFDTGKLPAAAKPGPGAAAAVPAAPGAPAAAPPPKHRLELAVEALKIPLAPSLVQRLAALRAQLEPGTRKMVMLHIEVLKAGAQPAQRGAALAAALTTALDHDGIADGLDEDGATLLFQGEDAIVPAVRALFAALCTREALNLIQVSLRAAAVFGKVQITERDEPLEGELPLRARTLAAKAPAGKIVVDRALSADVQDVVTLAELSSEALEAVDRRALLTNVTTLYGREQILAALDKRLMSLSQGLVAPVLVTGESGSGRSTLAQELGVRGRHQQAIVGIARVLPSLRGQPYAGLAELLCNVCGVAKEQRLTKLLPALEALKLSPTDLEAALVVAGVRAVPQPFTPGQAVYALRSVLSVGAPGRKVVLIFDGLESMDPYSIDAFRELCARPMKAELAIGLCEPAFARESLPQVPVAEMKGLHAPEVTSMITAWLNGAKVSERLIETIHRRSRGNPGLVIDWLHLLADKGLMRQRAGAFVLAAEPVSCDDHELAFERAKALWPYAGRLFEAACLAEDSIDSAVLSAAVPNVPPAAYQRLVGSRMLRALGGRRWAVASERYQQAGLKLEGTHRAELHKRLAGVLIETARAAQVPADGARVAEHLTRAKDATRAVQLWKGVADAAVKRRNPREVVAALRGWADALRVMSSAESLGPDVARARVETLARAAATAVACGEPLQARALVDEGQAAAQEMNIESAELALSQAKVLRSEARRARALEALDLAEKRAAGAAVSYLCFAERGETLEADGDLKGAAKAFRQAVHSGDAAQDLARWHGEIDFRARVETRLAGVLLAQKDVSAAKQIYLSALAAWRKAAYPYAEARVLANLGAVSVQTKELDEAARQFKEAAAAAARSGDLLFQARQMLNLAKVLKRSDQLQPAKQAAGAVRHIAQQIGWEEGKQQAAALGL